MLGGFGGALEELGGFGALESKHRTLGEERLNNCGLVSDKAGIAHHERGTERVELRRVCGTGSKHTRAFRSDKRNEDRGVSHVSVTRKPYARPWFFGTSERKQTSATSIGGN